MLFYCTSNGNFAVLAIPLLVDGFRDFDLLPIDKSNHEFAGSSSEYATEYVNANSIS